MGWEDPRATLDSREGRAPDVISGAGLHLRYDTSETLAAEGIGLYDSRLNGCGGVIGDLMGVSLPKTGSVRIIYISLRLTINGSHVLPPTSQPNQAWILLYGT